MNLLAHLSYIVVLDYVIFQYWYRIANRYTVLNFHEEGFLPARYIISGLVAGAFIYWAYLIPVLLLKRLHRGYHHPRWWLLWGAVAWISSIQVMMIVRSGTPPVEVWAAFALLAHLQSIHFIMLMIAERVTHQGLGSIFPGVRSAVVLMVMWLFWIFYSFAVKSPGEPQPIIGTALERYLLIIILVALIALGVGFRLGVRVQYIRPSDHVIPALDITVADVLDSFYAAWALFYVIIPVVQYLARGYVMAHSNLFPAFLLGLLLPTLWSLGVMWLILLISNPSLVKRLFWLAFFWLKDWYYGKERQAEG